MILPSLGNLCDKLAGKMCDLNFVDEFQVSLLFGFAFRLQCLAAPCMSCLSVCRHGGNLSAAAAASGEGRNASIGVDCGAILLGQALTWRDQRKSVICRVPSWHLMQPVLISV